MYFLTKQTLALHDKKKESVISINTSKDIGVSGGVTSQDKAQIQKITHIAPLSALI